MFEDVLYAFYVRPDALYVWKSEEVKSRLKWYYRVMNKEKPAMYLIAKRIPVPSDVANLKNMDEEALWDLHRELRKEFRSLWSSIANDEEDIKDHPQYDTSFLDVKIELAYRILSPCKMCENMCMVERASGKRGRCGLDGIVRVSSAFLHLGEEAPLVPSGTIFFTGCSLHCVYCQNWDISRNPYNGVVVDAEKLSSISRDLAARGARNINYVGGNPDQSLHIIVESLKYLNVNVPQLWNSNMYMSREALELLLDIMDIWLPDFKYGNSECAYKYSLVKNYFEVVSRNHKIVYDYGANIIIRHLVLPNHLECCTYNVLSWISENTPNVLVNVMDQYRPEYLVFKYPWKFKEISRRLTYEEIRRAYEYAEKKGICYKPVSK